jgi:hypothetical protein
MLKGNLQWARSLFLDCLRQNPVAGILAGRRLFRVLWAYWAACFVAAFALAWHGPLWPGIAILAALVLFSGGVRQLAGAALVSLSAPLLMIRAGNPQTGDWE